MDMYRSLWTGQRWESNMKKSCMQKTASNNGKNFLRQLWKNRILLLMIAPVIVYVFIFHYLTLPGIVVAFKNYVPKKGIWGSDWIGFKNFEFMIKNGTLWRVTWNTIRYNLMFMFFGYIFEIGVAVILSEIGNKIFKKVSQTIILLPHFLSWVVVGAMVYNILNTNYGVINSMLLSVGKEKIPFMTTPGYWPAIFVFARIWKGVGYGSIVYLAAITGIDQEIYEAAEIDGANIWQRIRHITLPSILPTFMVLLLLSLGKIVTGDFQMFYNLTGNSPLLYEATDILDTFVYRSLINTQNYGMSGAAGLYKSVVGFVIVLSVNKIIRKVEPDYALF